MSIVRRDFKRDYPRCHYCRQEFSSTSKLNCDICGEFCMHFCLKCQYCICLKCENSWKNTSKQEKTSKATHDKRVSFPIWISKIKYFLPLFCVILGCVIYIFSIRGVHDGTKSAIFEVKSFRKSYPLQKNDTWYHILSVLEVKHPTVKTIIFLHGKKKRTVNCLVKELVAVYSKSGVKMQDVTFVGGKGNEKDYGEVLEHYRPIVRELRILVTDLNEVNGKTARIFHTLCDEVSSDIKPSLFIFTLQYGSKTEKLKPLERATTILKETWSDLPENEIFPLLSRIVKNVVDVVPENDPCNL